MKVLIGCEESQVVCKAFRDRGHEAYSCDLVDTRGNPAWHHQDDIVHHIKSKGRGYYDLIILHPDCTKLSLSGNAHYGKNMPKHAERLHAIDWTVNLWLLATEYCDDVVLENPTSIIFKYLDGAIIQYIQPFMFGHTEQKKTGLAMTCDMKKLVETNNIYEEMMILPRKVRERVHFMSPGPNRKRDRSVTYKGIANAMAEQWG